MKNNAILSTVIDMLNQEFPEKFRNKKITFKGNLKQNVIKIRGNFNIRKQEVYKGAIDYNGEEETYKIILIPSKV